jgi:uncharacterized membrane protein YbhN (UPF0104 family)/tRNA A-37 threonylcarbamoyl transferase component Bud32
LRERDDVGHGESTEPGDGSWNIAILTESEPGRRNRRTVDSIVLFWAAIVLGLSAAIGSSAQGNDADVAAALVTLFEWAGALWRLAFIGAMALVVVIVIGVLARRRWDLVRDVVVAVLAVLGSASILGRIVESDWFPLGTHVLSRWGYPEVRLAISVTVIVVVGPELVRPLRLLGLWLVPIAALGAVVLGAARPSAVLAAFALGLGIGSLVRLAFGTAAGVPPVAVVRNALVTLGVTTADLKPSARQRIGSAEYVGHAASGRSLKVRVLSRDAQDTQRLARRWRSLAYRDPPRSVAAGRLEQVEHEALATLMAAQAGVSVPEVAAAALGPNGDAVLATYQPDTDPLESLNADEVSDEVLEKVCRQAARLHDAGISHGRLNAGNVLLVDGEPMLVDFSAATLGASQSALDIDVAELLVACAVLVGPERALGKAVDAGWGDSIGRVLPYLQRAALTPHLRDLTRTHEVGLKDLRTAAAAATGQTAPEIAPMRRVRPKDLLVMAGLIVAAYLLISQLASIGFGTIAAELRTADLAFVAVGLLIAQTTFVTSGISLRGAVPTPLPLLPCVVLQSALKFINLTVPSSAGRIAANLRCLQRMGAPRGEAIAGSALDDISNKVVQAALLLAVLPIVSVHLNTSQFHGPGPDRRLLIAIIAALVVSLGVVLAMPKVRARLVPGVRSALSSVRQVARVRRRRLEVFGGSVASELLYALALGAVCLAYGVRLNLAQLVFVNAAGNLLSDLIPAPGGIGAAEATLSATLIAVGVDHSTAFAIAITQRLCTFYLPPIWGFASLRWLTRNGYL